MVPPIKDSGEEETDLNDCAGRIDKAIPAVTSSNDNVIYVRRIVRARVDTLDTPAYHRSMECQAWYTMPSAPRQELRRRIRARTQGD